MIEHVRPALAHLPAPGMSIAQIKTAMNDNAPVQLPAPMEGDDPPPPSLLNL